MGFEGIIDTCWLGSLTVVVCIPRYQVMEYGWGKTGQCERGAVHDSGQHQSFGQARIADSYQAGCCWRSTDHTLAFSAMQQNAVPNLSMHL